LSTESWIDERILAQVERSWIDENKVA